MTKSVEATRAHLQGQLRSKEAENNRLTVQLRVQTLLAYCPLDKYVCDVIKTIYLFDVVCYRL